MLKKLTSILLLFLFFVQTKSINKNFALVMEINFVRVCLERFAATKESANILKYVTFLFTCRFTFALWMLSKTLSNLYL